MGGLDFVQQYFGEAISLGVGSGIAWFFARRKNNAEVSTTEIENGSKVVALYKEALDDLSTRYEAKYSSVSSLYEQKEAVLRQEVEYLQKELNLWKKKYNALEKEFREYKKTHP